MATFGTNLQSVVNRLSKDDEGFTCFLLLGK